MQMKFNLKMTTKYVKVIPKYDQSIIHSSENTEIFSGVCIIILTVLKPKIVWEYTNHSLSISCSYKCHLSKMAITM